MTRRGLITVRHRREAVIETGAGGSIGALVKGRHLKPLAGDEVVWHTAADGTAVIDEILPRRCLLERIDRRGRAEGVAANVDLVLVVVAPRPPADWQLVDRYLAAASLLDIDAALVRNKTDLPDADLDRRAAVYSEIGYTVVGTSTERSGGVERLGPILMGRRSVLVGQSGVGKSSLINALLDADAQAVAGLSRRRSLGRHTTTAAMLYRLPGGGELIDSPGVRRYAPYIANPADVASGFREFRPYGDRCRFGDCRHFAEPGCAVREAVDRGEISDARYASYKTLRETVESLAASSSRDRSSADLQEYADAREIRSDHRDD